MIYIGLLAVSMGNEYTYRNHEYGADYDISSLARPFNDPYVVDSSDGSKYFFNFGSMVPNHCGEGSVIQEFYDKHGKVKDCVVWGVHTNVHTKYIDKDKPFEGFLMGYHGGDLCTSDDGKFVNENRKIVFKFKCKMEGADSDFYFKSDYDEFYDCRRHLTIKTKYGCPADFLGGKYGSWSLSWTWIIFVCIFGALLLYCVFGIIYNW
jgi:hypothetical protein